MNDKKQTLSIELPNPIYATSSVFSNVKNTITTFFSESFSRFQSGIAQSYSGLNSRRKAFGGFKMPKFNFNFFKNFKFNKKNLLKIGVPIFGVLILLFVISQVFTSKPSIQGVSDETSIDQPLATQDINREFSFPLRDDTGEEVGKFKYIIQSAEKRKQIIVKGQRATAVEGRVFLILNLKLVNDLDQGININTRDYVRIYVNADKSELFAPDIHNDPVEAQAISTKNTRVGLAINEDDHDIVVKVGEIDGDKEEIKLSL